MISATTTLELPAAVRLGPRFDPDRLKADLHILETLEWPPKKPYRFEGFFGGQTPVFHDGKWVGLSLRSQGGRANRTDPGGPALEEFADTPLLAQVPYLAEVLRSLNAPLRSARLLRLPPGAAIGEHRDTYHGLEYGQIRLHLPITTNDRVENTIRGEHCRWLPGELWYGDFGSLHSGRNNGTTDRVHLVVDVLLVPAVFDLFPASVAETAMGMDVLFHEESIPIAPDDLQAFECAFELPATLVRGIFDIDDGIQAQLGAAIHRRGGRLVLAVEGRDVIALTPLSGDRFRCAGWTMERYFQFSRPDARSKQLGLVLRKGHRETRVVFDATFAA